MGADKSRTGLHPSTPRTRRGRVARRRAAPAPCVNRSMPSGGAAEQHAAAPPLVVLKVGAYSRGGERAPPGGAVMDVRTFSHILSPFTGTDNVRSEKCPVFLMRGGCPWTRTGVKRNHRRRGGGGDCAPAEVFIQMRTVLRVVSRGTTHRIGANWSTPPGRSPPAHARGPLGATLMGVVR